MPMETDADRLAMIRALGGVEFSTPRGVIEAVFDEGYAEAALDGATAEGVQPYLTCRTADVVALALAKGVMLTFGERVLRVVRHEPDGTGMSRIVVSA